MNSIFDFFCILLLQALEPWRHRYCRLGSLLFSIWMWAGTETTPMRGQWIVWVAIFRKSCHWPKICYLQRPAVSNRPHTMLARRAPAVHRAAPVANPLVGVMYPPQPLHWQILTFLAFAVPFCVCLYKFDINIAFGVFFIAYFIMSIIASFRAAQISRRFRVNENEFLQFMQQQRQANPQAIQDQSAALHLYLAMLDRDFTANGTKWSILLETAFFNRSRLLPLPPALPLSSWFRESTTNIFFV